MDVDCMTRAVRSITTVLISTSASSLLVEKKENRQKSSTCRRSLPINMGNGSAAAVSPIFKQAMMSFTDVVYR